MTSKSIFVGPIELRPDENPERKTNINERPSMDEIVAKNATVHFEMMDDKRLWVKIEAGGKAVVCWISARKGRLVFTAEEE